jgi:uncharacterized protein YciI
MPLYVITFMDKPGMLEARVAARDAHLAYLREAGATRIAGPFLDAEGRMVGSMLVVEAEDEAAARALADNDPYKAAGLFDDCEVRAWRHGYGQLT